jgi:predicted DNA-binding ribbon-helix-helix protein
MTKLLKRSLKIGGKRTSIALERQYWDALERLARSQGDSVSAFISSLSAEGYASLASRLRVYAIENFPENHI